MLIIVTDMGNIWNHENPLLKQVKDVVLVVCLNGEKVTDEYECFVSPYKQEGMRVDQLKMENVRYTALESVRNKLKRHIGYHEDIVFLADSNPESLYPFQILKDICESNRMHLVTMSPWKFEGKERKEAHKELISDLTKVESLLYINSNDILDEADKISTYSDLMEYTSKKFSTVVIAALHQIKNMKQGHKYYFNFTIRKYIPLQEGYVQCVNRKSAKSHQKLPEFHRTFSTLGMIIPTHYPAKEEFTKVIIEEPVARPDGKKVCDYLRSMRVELANANGIKYEAVVCHSIGACAGTCAKCDEESRYLRLKMEKIPEWKRVYPEYQVLDWEVE